MQTSPRLEVALSGLLVLASCAAIADTPEVTYGNEKAGFLEVSYEHTEAGNPQLDWERPNTTALETCAGWGFTGAVPFTGGRDSCVDPGESAPETCRISLVKIHYQCVNQ